MPASDFELFPRRPSSVVGSRRSAVGGPSAVVRRRSSVVSGRRSAVGGLPSLRHCPAICRDPSLVIESARNSYLQVLVFRRESISFDLVNDSSRVFSSRNAPSRFPNWRGMAASAGNRPASVVIGEVRGLRRCFWARSVGRSPLTISFVRCAFAV